MTGHGLRHLVLVLGDQRDPGAAASDGFDAAQDRVWMAEVAEESTQVWSSKQRTVLFLSAMRHFADHLRSRAVPLRTVRDFAAHAHAQGRKPLRMAYFHRRQRRRHVALMDPANPTQGWPVTRAQGLQVLDDFIARRLSQIGQWQDPIWQGEPWLRHAHLASAMTLKVIHPREAVARAEAAYRAGAVPLAAAEGFIRQIPG